MKAELENELLWLRKEMYFARGEKDWPQDYPERIAHLRQKIEEEQK